ncbi:MAG TPA: pantetheine-phosphate adenylyltransferase [Bacteroidales bacterium]|nr:pantetheine-phosphate adenylyltransferase [Bacteroidales bacterium]HRZ49471.1 pantetheine-phosphate adenylyltransferase [Bacteroidales bacterium]
MELKTAVFPGSFDPVTRGHENVIQRALPLFDRIVVAIGENAEKRSMFPSDLRMEWIRKTFAGEPKVVVERYSGLTVDFCKSIRARYILRGIRTSADFEFERSIGQINKILFPEIETLFFLSTPEFTALNSSIVRDIIKHGGNPDPFVPEALKGLMTL